jgi:hypothetical protein
MAKIKAKVATKTMKLNKNVFMLQVAFFDLKRWKFFV